MRHTRIVVTRYGGSDVLQALEEECPEPKPGEVRIKAQAAGVSPAGGGWSPTASRRSNG